MTEEKTITLKVCFIFILADFYLVVSCFSWCLYQTIRNKEYNIKDKLINWCKTINYVGGFIY